jgi:hypothetical protein
MRVLHTGANCVLALASPSLSLFPALQHDPEKWQLVFVERSCSSNKPERDDDSKKSHPALGIVIPFHKEGLARRNTVPGLAVWAPKRHLHWPKAPQFAEIGFDSGLDDPLRDRATISQHNGQFGSLWTDPASARCSSRRSDQPRSAPTRLSACEGL